LYRRGGGWAACNLSCPLTASLSFIMMISGTSCIDRISHLNIRKSFDGMLYLIIFAKGILKYRI